MAYEQKEGDIAVFYQNPAEKKNLKAPDWSGECMIDGKVRRIALWYPTNPDGSIKSSTMIRGKIEDKRDSYGAAPPNPSAPPAYEPAPPQTYGAAPPSPADDLDDEIPF